MLLHEGIQVQSSIRVVSREDSVLGIAERSTEYVLSEAEEEILKKKKDKIAEINNEVDRRKTSFEIV